MKKKKSAGKRVEIVAVLFLTLILGLFFFTSCSDDDEEDGNGSGAESEYQDDQGNGNYQTGNNSSPLNNGKPYGDPDTSWTVLLYLCGTDLESENGFASINLNEVCLADLKENVNFVIEAGGTKSWQMDGLSNGELTRLHLENGEMYIDETCPSSSMGDADTLEDFIKWGTSNYPADRYMLVFWDHGGGSLFGLCQDEIYGGDSLSLKEVRTAIENARVPFEVAGFDTCLMSTLETAETLHGYAHYMVASEETEPGTGWDYTAWINYLSKNTGCSGKELGRAIVDSYMEKCSSYDLDSMATLSVSDLTELPKLSQAFRDYSGELVMTTQNASDFQAVVQGATQSESYGERSGSEGTYDMVDLGDLMNNTGGILTEHSDDVLNALKNVVVYESHGSYRSKASGLSVFYPKYIDNDVYEAYEDISDNTAYLEFASIVNGDWDSAEWETAWHEAYETHNNAEETSGGFFDSLFNGGIGDNGSGTYEEDEEEEEEEEEEENTEESEVNGSSGGFVESFFGNSNSEESVNLFQSLDPVKPGDEELKYEQYLSDNNTLNLNISSGIDIVKDVRFRIAFEQDDENYMYLGCDRDINADYEKGEFSDNFHGTWITIGGEFVCAEVIGSTDDYNLYIIPAKVNGEETFIRAVYEYDKEAYRVLGTYDGADEETNLSGRDIHPLKAGDKIDFIFYTFNINTDDDDEGDEMISGSIVWSDDTEMLDEEMDDSRFIYMLEIEDIFGNETDCDPVFMEIKNGEISAYDIE